MKKENTVYIRHILDSIGRIEKYTHRITSRNFMKNDMVQSAVMRELEIIGEAVKKLSREFKESHTDIPWKQIAGMRDKLIHDYFGVDKEAVWKTIQEDIPVLKNKIENILGTDFQKKLFDTTGDS